MFHHLKELQDLIKEAQSAYYTGTPIMPDQEYDDLIEFLKTKNPEDPLLKTVGTSVRNTPLAKVKHYIKMGSQNKVNTEQEFDKFVKSVGLDKFVLQEKLDGLSVELIYENGNLVYALSRGSGTEGEDITHNVSHMLNVHQTIKDFTGSLRGEILIYNSVFKEYFKDEYTVARNAASGVARMKISDSRVIYLKVVYYDVICDDNFEFEHEKIKKIMDLGLEPVATYPADSQKVKAWYKKYEEEKREKLDYDIDGLVIKVDSLAVQEELGETDNRPLSQVAWKFSNKGSVSRITDITWEVGKTGRVSPVAHVEPVVVGGVTISKASVYNKSYIEKLGLGIGAEVLVVRANDVIPRIEKVISEGQQTEIPTNCPSCKEKLEVQGEYLVCKNQTCGAKCIGDLEKWVEITKMDEVGPAFLQDMLNCGLVKDSADLYALSPKKILDSGLAGYKAKSSNKICDVIQSKRELALPIFLAALNIPEASEATFTSLAESGHTLESLMGASVEDLVKVRGIGEITAGVIVEGLKSKKNLIEKLLNFVKIEERKIGKLTGMSFCFTGEISIKRGKAQQLVRDKCGTVKTSVSRGLTYLVQANKNSTSGKSQKAKSYGTQVISEEEFYSLVDFDPIEDLLKD